MKKNQKGSVLIAVALLSLVMTVIAMGIIALSSSQSLSNRHQIERMKAEQIARGAFWYNYMSRINSNTSGTPDPEILDNKKFVPSISSAPGGPSGTEVYTVVVDYNLPN